jgi:hypothetical protein
MRLHDALGLIEADAPAPTFVDLKGAKSDFWMNSADMPHPVSATSHTTAPASS